MLLVSLVLNVIVLIPICTLLLTRSRRMDEVYGPVSAGRNILLALYLTILAASLALLATRWLLPAATLLAMQIAYKVMTPFTVGSIRNPVVISNLAIAAVHAVTLAVLHGEIAAALSP